MEVLQERKPFFWPVWVFFSCGLGCFVYECSLSSSRSLCVLFGSVKEAFSCVQVHLFRSLSSWRSGKLLLSLVLVGLANKDVSLGLRLHIRFRMRKCSRVFSRASAETRKLVRDGELLGWSNQTHTWQLRLAFPTRTSTCASEDSDVEINQLDGGGLRLLKGLEGGGVSLRRKHLLIYECWSNHRTATINR